MVENDKSRYLEQRETILRYLETSPRAADTVEGVVNWWLPRQRYRDAYQDIEKILEELAADALSRQSADGVLVPDAAVRSCRVAGDGRHRVGRKAWLFSDTPAGANASAIIYSLVETAKANGVEPYTWLRYVLEHLPAAQTADEMDMLLPWNFHTATLANITPR